MIQAQNDLLSMGYRDVLAAVSIEDNKTVTHIGMQDSCPLHLPDELFKYFADIVSHIILRKRPAVCKSQFKSLSRKLFVRVKLLIGMDKGVTKMDLSTLELLSRSNKAQEQ